jgi:hypothetical protein
MLLKKIKNKTQEMCKNQRLKGTWEHAIEGPKLECDAYVNPLRVNKVNIGTKEKPKFVNIGTMRVFKILQTYCVSIKVSFRQPFQI